MQKQLSYYLTIGLSLMWMLLIFLDYWYYHQPTYLNNILNFEYGTLSGIFVFLGLGVYLLVTKLGSTSKPFILANGVGMMLLFFILCAFSISMHISQLTIPVKFTGADTFQFLGRIFSVLFITYFITVCCFVLGDFVFEKIFTLSFSRLDNTLLNIAVGMLIISIILFILGVFKLLLPFVIGPLLLIILGVFYRRTGSFIQYTLIKPINTPELNILGFASFYMIIIFISLVYIQNIRPFPYGFDALAIYMNLPNLIGKEHGLVSGFSPYYWSLFVALGHIVFDNLSIVISLSVLGGILSGFSIYSICEKWITKNQALFITALFFSLPLVNFHAFRDIKTDLGLLFFMLTVFLLLVNYMKSSYPNDFKKENILAVNQIFNKRKTKKRTNSIVQEKKVVHGILDGKVTKEFQYIILLGLMSGMALGTKLTALILIFSIIGVLVYNKNGEIGLLTAALLFMFIILVGKLDAASGLRIYHFGATEAMWFTFIIGVGGLMYIAWKDRDNLLQSIKIIAVYASVIFLIYLPWPIKNYTETGIISINTFIQGQTSGQEIKEFSRKMVK